MDKTKLFTKIIDIIYFMGVVALVVALGKLFFGELFFLDGKLDIADFKLFGYTYKESVVGWHIVNIADFKVFEWMITFLIFTSLLVGLMAFYYLRNVSQFLLINEYFSKEVISNLRKSGKWFLLYGIITFIISTIDIIVEVLEKEFIINYDVDLSFEIFPVIIGLFFIIQSNVLGIAKNIKEENELTV